MLKSCQHCGSEANINGNNWNGESYERINLCMDCYETVGFAKAPRRPRQARQARHLYGDFAQLAQLHRIATDGSGRSAR